MVSTECLQVCIKLTELQLELDKMALETRCFNQLTEALCQCKGPISYFFSLKGIKILSLQLDDLDTQLIKFKLNLFRLSLRVGNDLLALHLLQIH